ncbi:MAG: GIY-YIG nuclease family protein [Bacteroidales bacterium]|nr:GIY-YIG nuclease family protein [Bacteroidales bacterium]
MYYLYILYSESFDKYYVGVTDNPDRRLWEHNNLPRNTFTSRYRPWIFVALFECARTQGEARKIESFIKKQKSRKLIQKIVDQEPLTGILAQLVRVPFVRD